MLKEFFHLLFTTTTLKVFSETTIIEWYSHWDGKVYQGGQGINVVTPLHQVLIFL